jgi:hypothetical protein
MDTIQDLYPMVLQNLNIKDLKNVSLVNKQLNNNIKYIRQIRKYTKSNIKCILNCFVKWNRHVKILKLRKLNRNVCSWTKKPKSMDEAILLF